MLAGLRKWIGKRQEHITSLITSFSLFLLPFLLYGNYPYYLTLLPYSYLIYSNYDFLLLSSFAGGCVLAARTAFRIQKSYGNALPFSAAASAAGGSILYLLASHSSPAFFMDSALMQNSPVSAGSALLFLLSAYLLFSFALIRCASSIKPPLPAIVRAIGSLSFRRNR